MVNENRHLSLREITAELSVSHESIRTIFNDCLGMKRVAARLVPRDLNFFQKLNRVKMAEDMLERVNSDPTFIKRIVTGDETLVCLIWLRPTFFSFQNSNYHFEAPVFSRKKT